LDLNDGFVEGNRLAAAERPDPYPRHRAAAAPYRGGLTGLEAVADLVSRNLPARVSAPVVVGLAGSVAVGKSTTARLLARLIGDHPGRPSVAVVGTDSFLLPNAQLERLDLMKRKGFPESYDQPQMLESVAALAAGADRVAVPVYSQRLGDIVPGAATVIDRGDVLIVEGLHVLGPPSDGRGPAVSNYLDLRIYLDASLVDIRRWYLARRQELCAACRNPSGQEPAGAAQIWRSVNEVNLLTHIAPTRRTGDVVVTKGPDHNIRRVVIRRVGSSLLARPACAGTEGRTPWPIRRRTA
jgi:type I pantothenate kinase